VAEAIEEMAIDHGRIAFIRCALTLLNEEDRRKVLANLAGE